MQNGNIPESTYYATLSNANEVLAANNLPAKNWDPEVNDNKYNIPWEDWKLILTIDGVDHEYHSLYKDQADLEAHYA